MTAIFKLINSYYWKGFFGPFFTIFFPFILIFLMGNVTYSTALINLKTIPNLSDAQISEKMISLAKQIIGGVLISTVISNGLIGFPTTILEFKKTILIKRIGSANVKIQHFLAASLLYQLIWTVFAIIWIPLVGTIILAPNQYLNWSIGFHMGLVQSIPLIVLTFVIGMSMGLFIISMVKSYVGASSIANLVYFPIAFLSGGFGNGEPRLDYAPAIKYIATYLIPTNYATSPFYKVYEGGYQNLWTSMGWQSYGFPIIGIIIAMIFLGFSIKFFKWGE